jgi:flagellar L-ring protein precursor FlgH
VGDTLMVNIVEKVSAVQKSHQHRGPQELGMLRVRSPRCRSSRTARCTAPGLGGTSGNSEFDGKGTTENSNDFSGTITATVVQVLPNGHLMIPGEKQIGVNANVDVLRFSGQVDPRAIQPGNTVPAPRSPTCG